MVGPGKPGRPYIGTPSREKRKKSVMFPGDPTNPFAVAVAKEVSAYLRRNRRWNRVTLSMNDEEMKLAREAAKAQKVPVSTILRACAMLGLAAFLQAKNKPAKDSQ